MRILFRRSRRVSERGRTVRLRLEALEDRIVPSANPLLVTNLNDSGDGSLRAAVTYADQHAASTIDFAPGLHGTIKLSMANGELDISKNTIINGPGANLVTVSGSDATRVFAIDAGVTAEIDGLTISNGLAAIGGGIVDDGGILTLSHDVISDNVAQGASGAAGQAASGGGVAAVDGAILNISFSTLSQNRAVGGDATGTGNGGVGEGGGLYNGPGSMMVVTADLITDNHAVGGAATGSTGTGGRGLGGGIDNVGDSTRAASLPLSHSTLIDNRAEGGAGHPGGAAMGGGIQSVNPTPTPSNPTVNPSELTVSDSTFTDNQAVGGDGGGFVFGGAIRNGFSDLKVTGSTFTDNLAQGGSGGSGGLQPGAVYGGALSCTFIVDPTTGENVTSGEVASSMFRNNQAVGGNDNTGGSSVLPGTTKSITVPGVAAGGAILQAAGNLKVSDSVFTGNQALGGADNIGSSTADYSFVGSGNGGAVFVLLNVGTTPGSVTINNSTFTNNQAKGGTGNLPGTAGTSYVGYATAGAIGTSFGGTLDVRNSTLANNQASGGTGADGQDGGDAVGGGIANLFDHLLFQGGSLFMSNDTLANNQAIGGAGGTGGGKGGDGLGGGAYNESNNATISGSRIVGNDAIGVDGGEGFGGGFYDAPTVTIPAELIDNIIEGNHASTSDPNIFPLTEETTTPEAMLIDALMSLVGNKDKHGA